MGFVSTHSSTVDRPDPKRGRSSGYEVAGQQECQPSLFDAPASRAARDKGISRVTKHVGSPWVAAAAADFAAYLRREGPAPSERWKEDYLCRGGEPPQHYNGYGAAVRYASQEGLIEATDRSILAKSIKAHARRVQIWKAKR